MTADRSGPLVPDGFEPPLELATERFLLRPLGPEHNVSDRQAWTSSIDHIRATAGAEGRSWPTVPLSLEENLADLEGHASEFKERVAFAYTVLDPGTEEVIGCVYFDPPRREGVDVDVWSWVSESHAELDEPLYSLVNDWLATSWPWATPDYAPRR